MAQVERLFRWVAWSKNGSKLQSTKHKGCIHPYSLLRLSSSRIGTGLPVAGHLFGDACVFCSFCFGGPMFLSCPIWLWLKKPTPKWNPGKWRHGPKPAACPSCLILTHTHFQLKNKNISAAFELRGISCDLRMQRSPAQRPQHPVEWLAQRVDHREPECHRPGDSQNTHTHTRPRVTAPIIHCRQGKLDAQDLHALVFLSVTHLGEGRGGCSAGTWRLTRGRGDQQTN